jgi:hypothetical protein
MKLGLATSFYGADGALCMGDAGRHRPCNLKPMERDMAAEPTGIDRDALELRVARLAAERTTLFQRANTNGSLTAPERARLTSTERDLDECFLALRRQRAMRDSRRFDLEHQVTRRGIGPPAPPKGSAPSARPRA